MLENLVIHVAGSLFGVVTEDAALVLAARWASAASSEIRRYPGRLNLRLMMVLGAAEVRIVELMRLTAVFAHMQGLGLLGL